MLAYLWQHPCSKCGQSDPLVLEFHHHKPGKTADVYKLVNNGAGAARLRREIKLCTVLCANCHRRVTHRQSRSFRYGAVTMARKAGKRLARVKVPATIEVDWSALVVRTSRGTALTGMTMQRVEADLDAWLFYQRTGVNVVEKIIITYNSIARQLKLDPKNKGEFSDKDKKKVLEFLENDKTFGFHAWLTKAAAGKTASAVDIPEDFKEEAATLVHTLYDKHAKGNILPLQRLSTFYAGATELDLDKLAKAAELKDPYDAIDLYVRAYLKQNAATFSIQAGANPDVKRLQKPGKGNKVIATGLEAYTVKTRKGVKNKPKQVAAPANGAKETVVELDEEEEDEEEQE